MKIKHIDTEQQVFIVAEIGNNHEGDLGMARDMIHAAAESGVDAVKFQTFRTELYVSQSDQARFERLKSFELSTNQFGELSTLARELGLMFISTPFDLTSAEFLENIVDAYKIASGDNTFYPLIKRVVDTGLPLIISTGISDGDQTTKLVDFIEQQWSENQQRGELALLHCVSSYPTPPEQANLRTIQFLQEKFDHTIGYSDHTLGVDAAVLSVALGAQIIEKHFTLDKSYSDFRDHQLSADPPEMKELVQRVRLASQMLGSCAQNYQPCEEANVGMIRRSIVAGRDLPQGHFVTQNDLTWIRPAGGLSPGEEHLLVGKKLKSHVRFGEVLQVTDVE